MSEDVSHYEYVLDNDFFISIDAPEIQKGKLRVALTVKKSMGVFVLNFHTEGFVVVPCDRCLDDMEIPVDIDDELKVKMGATFSDENDKINLSLLDVGGELLVVSQFTLYADCRKGNRPSFFDALEPDRADALYEKFVAFIE